MGLIGAHVSVKELKELHGNGSRVAQIFLGSPRSYAAPTAKPEAAALSGAGMKIYAHSAYLINLASANPRVVDDSATALLATLAAAQESACSGVVVHAGQAGAGASIEEGIERWQRALEGVTLTCPLLIENTAGGKAAPGRAAHDLAVLLEAVRGAVANPEAVGVCIDTAHAHASGDMSFEEAEQILKQNTGHPALIHVNDSKDEQGSGRDRHENLGSGLIGSKKLGQFLKNVSETDMVVETPGGMKMMLPDIEWIKEAVK